MMIKLMHYNRCMKKIKNYGNKKRQSLRVKSKMNRTKIKSWSSKKRRK